jgi:hypothetical protein
MKSLNLIHAKIYSDNLSDAAHAAYWLECHAGAEGAYSLHINAIDEAFFKLAEALGYRVEKIEQPAPPERADA